MNIKCYHCKHKWNYKGKSKADRILCPSCRKLVYFSKLKGLKILEKVTTTKLKQTDMPEIPEKKSKRVGWDKTKAPEGKEIILDVYENNEIGVRQIGFQKLKEVRDYPHTKPLMQDDNFKTGNRMLVKKSEIKDKTADSRKGKPEIVLKDFAHLNPPNLEAIRNKESEGLEKLENQKNIVPKRKVVVKEISERVEIIELKNEPNVRVVDFPLPVKDVAGNRIIEEIKWRKAHQN